MDRRDFLALSTQATGLAACYPHVLAAKTRKQDDHFFLSILYPGGADWSYLWDSRPLQMTVDGHIQNFRGTEAIAWESSADNTLVTPYADNFLGPVRPYFSLLNGVHMMEDNLAHNSNLRFALHGGVGIDQPITSALSLTSTDLPIENVRTRNYPNAVVPATVGTDVILTFGRTKLLQSGLAPPKHELMSEELQNFLMKERAEGGGAKSQGTRLIRKGMNSAEKMRQRILDYRFESTGDRFQDEVVSCVELFRKRITFASFLSPRHNLDAHGLGPGRMQPTKFNQIARELRFVIDHLRETQYDKDRSMFDVTTVMVTSEFSRTMRKQAKGDPQANGTDHNNLANSVLLAGKGIKGGLILGSTDYRSSNEKLSGAHVQKDRQKKRVMGLPFNFEQSHSQIKAMPKRFFRERYLCYENVTNTLFQVFDVDKKHYRSTSRSGPPARIVTGVQS